MAAETALFERGTEEKLLDLLRKVLLLVMYKYDHNI
jgi:hypothetical protein